MRTTIASTKGVGNVEQQIGGVDIAGLITRLHKHRAGTPLLSLFVFVASATIIISVKQRSNNKANPVRTPPS